VLTDKEVYLIGIGGCGMSGLARMLVSGRARVRGSDAAVTAVTESLVREGVSVESDQAPLPPCDAVIASAAIKPDHPQYLEAEARGLTVLTYAEALGMCMAARTGVALAGTHGKSTTTAMLGAALVDAGLDPSVIVGAQCAQLARGALAGPPSGRAGGFRLGSGQVPVGPLRNRPGLLVCEACEFNRSFHNLRPTVASISAVEADHLDVYGSLDAVIQAFHEFAQLVPAEAEGGQLLIAHDGAHRREITGGLDCKIQTIGFSPNADFSVVYDPETHQVGVSHHRELIAQWTMRLPGEHNATNAATACALAVMLGADPKIVAESLGAFAGVVRRTQLLGERSLPTGGSVRVWDDYGHHPTEIEKTLRALRDHEKPELTGGRLVCVFQPHQHSRTRFLLEEFASSFEQADVVIVPHIYFVRDSQAEKQKVSAADLVDRLRKRGVRAMHLYPFDAIVEQLESTLKDGDVLVVMGAGPVWEVARDYMTPDLTGLEHAEGRTTSEQAGGQTVGAAHAGASEEERGAGGL